MSILTHEEVLATIGPLDDVAVAEIIGTGVTGAELIEAQAWVNAHEAADDRHRVCPPGHIAQVIEILEQIEMVPSSAPDDGR
jgi:hypothetical protein